MILLYVNSLWQHRQHFIYFNIAFFSWACTFSSSFNSIAVICKLIVCFIESVIIIMYHSLTHIRNMREKTPTKLLKILATQSPQETNWHNISLGNVSIRLTDKIFKKMKQTYHKIDLLIDWFIDWYTRILRGNHSKTVLREKWIVRCLCHCINLLCLIYFKSYHIIIL